MLLLRACNHIFFTFTFLLAQSFYLKPEVALISQMTINSLSLSLTTNFISGNIQQSKLDRNTIILMCFDENLKFPHSIHILVRIEEELDFFR